jgi:serine/threonine-protein kinase
LIFLLGENLFNTGPETVAVPSVKAQTVEEATLALTGVGLVIGTQTPQADDNAPKGTIIGQDPAAGELIELGQAVNLTISAGKEQTSVPDLIDLTSSEDARLALTEAKLVLGKVTPKDSDKPEGTVIAQEPEANSSVDVGTLVSITVSSGKIPVPNVVGKSQSAAKNTLLNAGFEVEIITEEDGTVPAGTVTSQSPEAKKKTLRGTTVTLTVASTPKPISCPDGTTVPWNEVCPEPPTEPAPA